MAFQQIPAHEPVANCTYLAAGMCYYCCETCNEDRHICQFCGDPLTHQGLLLDGTPNPCYEEEAEAVDDSCPDCGLDPNNTDSHRDGCRRIFPKGHPLERLQFGPPWEAWPE